MQHRALLLLAFPLAATAAAGQRWTHTSSGLPPGREDAVICYDPLRARTILFGGGWPGGPTQGDTWAYDGSRWTRIPTTTAPPARRQHAMVYDTRRHAIILFGGSDANGTLSDTWEFTANGWRQLATVTAPRDLAAMAYDSNRGRTVLLTASGETWGLDSASGSWLHLRVGASPGSTLRTMTYDAGRDRVLAFGGEDCLFGSGDVWEFDGSTWQRPTSSGRVVPCRVVMTYDAAGGRSIAFGGYCRTAYCGETWAYDGATATWSPAARAAGFGSPLASYSHSITYDSRRGVMVLLTAQAFGSVLDTWELEIRPTPRWSAYGAGCAGSQGAPRLRPTPGSQPALGSSFELELDRLPTTASATVFLFGFDTAVSAATPLPIPLDPLLPGCRLWLDPEWTITQPHAGRTTRVRLTIPDLPALAGLQFAQQALSLDPSARGGIGSMSNGGIATIE